MAGRGQGGRRAGLVEHLWPEWYCLWPQLLHLHIWPFVALINQDKLTGHQIEEEAQYQKEETRIQFSMNSLQ